MAVEVAGSEGLSGMLSREMRARWALGHWDSSGRVEVVGFWARLRLKGTLESFPDSLGTTAEVVTGRPAMDHRAVSNNGRGFYDFATT